MNFFGHLVQFGLALEIFFQVKNGFFDTLVIDMGFIRRQQHKIIIFLLTQNWHRRGDYSTCFLRTSFVMRGIVFFRLFFIFNKISQPMKRILLTLFFAMATTAAILAQQPNYDTVRIRPVLVSNNLYMLKGSGGNIGVLIGSDGTLMIDDQFAPLSNKINGAIKTLSPGEIKFLINTHVHGDHTGGNDNFKKMGITILAQDQVRERMTKETVNRMNEKVPPRGKDALPDITFADKLNLHINDEDIELIHFDPGHTDGDVIVHFKKADVYHMGDM